MSRSPGRDLWTAARRPTPARARFDRSDAGRISGIARRSLTRARGRGQQVGLDARAEHLPRLLLPADGGARWRGTGRPAVRRHHRSRIEARDRRRAGRFPPRLRRRPVNRRPVLRAVAVRRRARGRDGARPGALAGGRGGDGRRLPCRKGAVEPGRLARAAPRNLRDARARQADARRVAAHLRPWRLAGAAHRGVHRQERPRHHSRRPRKPRVAVGVRTRSRVCLRAPHLGSRRRAGCGRRGTRRRGTPRRPARRCGTVCARRRVLPMGDRHRGRRRRHGDQPLRPAGCRGQQDRDAQADLRLRSHGTPAGRIGCRSRWRDGAVHRSRQSGTARRGGRAHRRPRRGCARTSRAWAPAITSPCWPTSR